MTQFIKTIVSHSIILLSAFSGFAQSTYLPQGSKSDHFLERLEIRLQTNPELNIFTPKPLSRKVAVQVGETADSLAKFYPYDQLYALSKRDQYNMRELLM